MYEVLKTALEVQFPFNMIIVLGGLGILMAGVAVVATEVRKYATHRADLDTKRELAAQGMSADEIERVLQSGGGTARAGDRTKA